MEEQGSTCVTNGILLCRPHHRMKRRDGWWPRLHPDGTVTCTHPDHEPRVTRPAAHIQDWVQTLIHYPQRDCHDEDPDREGETRASETRVTYDAGPSVPQPSATLGLLNRHHRRRRDDRKRHTRPPPGHPPRAP
ncbi:MAG: hypothetical protein ACR2MA_01080 [Egibacteraceae bacterium]